MSDFETVRALLKDARLEHKATCSVEQCPAADRWDHEAFDALDRIEAEVEQLRAERDALQRRFDERLWTRPKVSRRDLATRNRTLLAEVERLRAELNRFRKHFGLETDWEFE